METLLGTYLVLNSSIFEFTLTASKIKFHARKGRAPQSKRGSLNQDEVRRRFDKVISEVQCKILCTERFFA